jgi:C4-dicarboxylate-specific signal transduction histidine kinase
VEHFEPAVKPHDFLLNGLAYSLTDLAVKRTAEAADAPESSKQLAGAMGAMNETIRALCNELSRAYTHIVKVEEALTAAELVIEASGIVNGKHND